MRTCIVIPARLGSTRLAEKALADIHGKPMVQHVYEKARLVRGVDVVLVATDHDRILNVVKSFGGQAVMTPETLQSGTDRVAFVAKSRSEDVFVNIQGDEPLLDPISVERSLELVRLGRFSMATPAAPLADEAALKNPNVVKVLVDRHDRAIYFSRFAIPYSRGPVPDQPTQLAPRHHLGVYVYERETLLKFAALERSSWETAESLEQLRALYHGIPIGVAKADRASVGVDTHEDLEFARRALLG